MTLHRNKLLCNKTNRRTNFSNLFLSRKSTCFRQFLCPSSGVFHCTFGTGVCHRGLITYTSAECTAENSWLWAEELLETCRFFDKNKFEKLVRLVGYLKRNQRLLFHYTAITFRSLSLTCAVHDLWLLLLCTQFASTTLYIKIHHIYTAILQRNLMFCRHCITVWNYFINQL